MKNLLQTILFIIAFVMMNHFVNAQNGTVGCNCRQAGWGCMTLDYNCRMYCYSYCGDYCIKHPKQCARLSESTNFYETSLNGTFPNPLLISATVYFSLEESENISIKIFDLNGRLVITLADSQLEEGEHQIEWNVADVNAGVYLFQFQSAEILQTEKLIVTK